MHATNRRVLPALTSELRWTSFSALNKSVSPCILGSWASPQTYFKSIYSRIRKRGNNKPIALPHADPLTFKCYLESAYLADDDFLELLHAEEPNDLHIHTVPQHLERLCCRRYLLWMLADYLGDAECKESVIVNLADGEFAVLLFEVSTVELVYKNATSGSGLRRWMCVAMAQEISSSDIQTKLRSYPQEVVLDVFEAFMKPPVCKCRGERIRFAAEDGG